MENKRNLFTVLGEWWDQRHSHIDQTQSTGRPRRIWFPTPGNVLFTLLAISCLVGLQHLGMLSALAGPSAQSISTGTIAYQGRLADASGNSLTDTVNMTFRLYAAANGGAPLWEEQWTGANSVQVSDGLFNVMLGSVNPIGRVVITGNGNLFLGITVGTDSEMNPRVQLGSVPFATQALTVPDGSITSEKLASDLIKSSSVSTSVSFWDIPSCSASPAEDSAWIAIPGLTVDLSADKERTVLLDFSGLGSNQGSGQAIYSNIFIDGVSTKLASGYHDLSGCRNSNADTTGDAWCSLTNSIHTTLAPGIHTIDVRVWCDGNDNIAKVYGGTLRTLELP